MLACWLNPKQSVNPKQKFIPATSKGHKCDTIINFSFQPISRISLKCNWNVPWYLFGANYIYAECTFPSNAWLMLGLLTYAQQ
jgi:hypothetical protein